VAVASVPLGIPYHASNVRLYDVSDDNNWRWLGAVSLGREPLDGMIRRVRLKGPTLYALTAGIGKGFQVVDLDVARSLFDGATAGGQQTADFWNMLRDLHGTNGFGQGAIMQTIPVENPGMGQNSQMWDMAILDMPVFGTTETAMVATGRSPLAVATASQGLLYNGDILDPNGAVAASWGFAIGTGIVNGVPLAAVSALGPSGPGSTEHVLAIIDLSNPTAPRAIGKLTLPGTAYNSQDIVVRDTTVFIGTATGTLMVNIADPMHPNLVGTIPSVSGRLAFSENGLLYGTYRGLAQITNPEGGVRTAALGGPLLLIPRVPPQLTREVATTPGLGGGEAEQLGPVAEEFISDVNVRVLLIGAENPSGGDLDLLQNGTPLLRQPLTFVNGRAALTIARGTRFAKGAELALVAGASLPEQRLVSPLRELPAGSVQILLDANNNRYVDLADPESASRGDLWTFWEALEHDVNSVSQLEDFGTVVLRFGVPTSQLRVRVTSDNNETAASTRWSLATKVESLASGGGPLDYVLHEATAAAQLKALKTPCAGTVQEQPCGMRGLSDVPQGLDSDFRGAFLRGIREGERHYLLRCDRCEVDSTRRLVVEGRDPERGWVEITSQRFDVRPVSEWVSVQNARSASDASKVANSLTADADWAPLSAREGLTMTVVVHGYAVNESGAKEAFGRVFRSLYWNALPVLFDAKSEEKPYIQPRATQVVGVMWPGNLGLTGYTYFPGDEFAAFQTGLPLASFFSDRKKLNQRLNIIAHSLGNLAVNNAISRTVSLQPVEDRYVMVDAAVAAEAFTETFNPASDPGLTDSSAPMTRMVLAPGGARDFGYPVDNDDADAIWDARWAGQLCDGGTEEAPLCGFAPMIWAPYENAMHPHLDPKPTYFRRWRSAQVPGSFSPWRGVFAGTTSRVSLFNAFNRNDQALEILSNVLPSPWRMAQLYMKPYSGLAGTGLDPYGFTWALNNHVRLDDHYINLWAGVAGTPAQHAADMRKWAELSFQFQPVSGAAGAQRLTWLSDEQHIDMTNEAGDGGLPLYPSHTYWTAPLWKISKLYNRVAQIFQRIE
jgi:hypothetical protein